MQPVVFQLNSPAISNTAQFVLSLASLIYVLSLQNKSKDCWIFIVALTINYVFYHAEGIFFDAYKHPNMLMIQQSYLSFRLLTHIWFSYSFGGNPFRREMFGVLAITAVLLLFSHLDYYQLGFYTGTWRIYLIGYAWVTLVWLRKSALVAMANNHDIADKKDLFDKMTFNNIIHELKHPSNQKGRAFRAFAGYCFIWFLVSVELNIKKLGGGQWMHEGFHLHLTHSVFFFATTYFSIIYLHFASEKTSFQAKLVGVVLCFVLALLGQIPFVLFGDGKDSSENVQNILMLFIYLIALSTMLIFLILPLFLKFTLLKPLKEIESGVKSVNAGDLSSQVTVEVNDEFGLLAQNFNLMTKSLHEYNSEMENLVTKRTFELQHSLSQLKATQNQLIQKEKLASLGELTAGIAHEIQNPLNFVNNFSELSGELIDEMNEEIDNGNLEEVKAISGDLKQNLEKITLHGKRASSIVKGMLEHSRTSTGIKELTDINKLSDEYLRLSYHGIRAKDSSFSSDYQTEFDENLPKIEVIPQDIGRVLLNLINNAFWAVKTVEKPLVTVKTEHTNNQIILKVIDNGTGMPESVKAKIFQPFFTTKPTGQGTGLGLSLTYDIVTKGHGGTIEVESVEGEGTTFIVKLPI